MKYILILLFISFPLHAFDAFLFDLDQMQDGEKHLKVVESNIAKVIYPKGYKVHANRVLNVLNSIHKNYENDLNVNVTKITIVLRPFTAYSNAYVTLAPKMSEFVTVPYMNNELGHGDWLDLLAIHEYRHVVQQQKELDQGDQILYYLLGQNGIGFHSVIKFPRWYYEGDGVYAETKYSNFARGDTSQFLRGIKALIYDKNIDYDIAYLGSLDEYYPDYYKMGYLIMTYLRENYEPEVIEKIIQHANLRLLNFFAFEGAIEKYTGKKLSTIFNESQEYFRKRWKIKDQNISFTKTKDFTKESKNFESYSVIEKSSHGIVALKSSMNDISKFVLVKKGKEKHLFYPTTFSDDSFSVYKDKMVYADLIPNLRYGLKSQSVIKEYDLKLNKITTLIDSGFNYFPKLKGSTLLYVNYDGFNYRIETRDIKLGLRSEIYRTKNRISSVEFFNNSIAFVEYIENTSVIKVWNSNKIKTLNSIDNGTVWSLKSNKNLLYYLSNSEGVSNLYSIDKSQNIQKHISSRFGILSFAVGTNTIFVSDFSTLGAKIKTIKKTNIEKSYESRIFQPITKQITEISNEVYKDRDLGTFENTFNFHSWNLFPDAVGNSLYFSGSSRNVLNTMKISAGLTYNTVEQGAGVYSTISFSTFLGVWDFGVQSLRRSKYNADTLDIINSWQETNISFGPRVELDFSRNAFVHTAKLFTSAGILDAGDSLATVSSELDETKLLSFDYGFIYTFTKKLASMDIQPDYGFDVFFDYIKGSDISGNPKTGEKTSAYGNIYLPFIKTFGLKLTGMYEETDLSAYDYGTLIPFARGYDALTSSKWSGGAFELAFPISFTEIDISQWLYVKRVKGAIFYDYLTSYNSIPVRSAGAEISFLTHFFRSYDIAIDIGIRSSYLIDLEESNTELILGTAFSY